MGATGIGIILAGGAAGGLAGPFFLLLLRGRLSSLTALALAALGTSAGMVAFAFSPSLVFAVFGFALIGASEPVRKAVSDGYMQLAVTPEFRGRVGSLSQITRGLDSLSALLAGALAEVLGVEIALVIGAGVVGLVAIWLLATFKQYGVEGW